METNYTLKKLIRGGTALLFLFAFMLTGTLSAQEAPLKLEGPQDICISEGGTSAVKDYETGWNPDWIDEGNTVPGDPPYNWTWEVSTSHITNIDTDETDANIQWQIGSENVPGTEGGTVGAWVRTKVEVDGTVYQSDWLPVNLWVDIQDVTVTVPEEICFDEVADISAVTDPVVPNLEGYWETSGDGTFGDENALSTTYTPAATDVGNDITLTFIAEQGACPDTQDEATMFINVEPTITVDAVGPFQTLPEGPDGICFDATFDIEINGVAGVAEWEFTWSLEGPDGSFVFEDEPGVTDGGSFTQLVDVSDLAVGVHEFTITSLNDDKCDASAGSLEDYTIVFEVLPEPTIFVDAVGDFQDIGEDHPGICFDAIFDIEIDGVVGTPEWQFTWSLEGPDGLLFTDVPGETDQGETPQFSQEVDVSTLEVGIHTFTITALNDAYCEATAESLEDYTIVFEVLPEPTIEVTHDLIEYDFEELPGICFDGAFAITVGGVTGTANWEFGWEIEKDGATVLEGTDIAGAEDFVANIDVQEDLDGAGVYDFIITSLADAYCTSDNLTAYGFSFDVHPEPVATVAGLDEICYDETIEFQLEGFGPDTFGDTYEVTWFVDVYVDGEIYEDHEGVELETVTDQTSYTFDPLDPHGMDLSHLTYYIDVYATIENQWGCEYTTEKEDLTIREKPFVVENEIKDPQIDQEDKYVSAKSYLRT